MVSADPAAVLLTGSYGVGKSTVALEIADLLEKSGESFAVLDLDFLGWFETGSENPVGEDVWLANVAAVTTNYLAVGVTSFVVAGYMKDALQLEQLRSTLAMPLTVVRLTASWSTIENRLLSDPTSGRAADLREASTDQHAEACVGLEDLTIPNDRPLPLVASDILRELGWLTR